MFVIASLTVNQYSIMQNLCKIFQQLNSFDYKALTQDAVNVAQVFLQCKLFSTTFPNMNLMPLTADQRKLAIKLLKKKVPVTQIAAQLRVPYCRVHKLTVNQFQLTMGRPRKKAA